MMKVNCHCVMDLGKLSEITAAQATALEQTADALHTEIVQAQVVPFKTGTLQGPAFFQDNSRSGQGEVTLIHSTPYARRLYFHPEYKFNKTNNPNARGEWFEPWISGKHKDFADKAYAQIYRRLAGL